MNKILLFGTFPEKGLEFFRCSCADRYVLACAGTYEELARHSDAAYFVLRGPRMGKEQILFLKKAKLLHRWGVGYNDVDVETAGALGIPVAITAGVNAQPVAEHAALLILASFRHLLQHVEDAKASKMYGGLLISDSWMINGRRAGILGLGNIGKRLAKILQGFGAEVVYYDAYRLPEAAEKELGIAYLPLEEVLKSSDIISLHMPLLESTHHMINGDSIGLMKKSALLVNTARGEIVDTEALLDAVEERRIWGAALDTVEGEPLPAGHRIFSMSHVLLTPHVSGNTEDNIVNMAACIFDNIERLERGESLPQRCVVNRQFLKK